MCEGMSRYAARRSSASHGKKSAPNSRKDPTAGTHRDRAAAIPTTVSASVAAGMDELYEKCTPVDNNNDDEQYDAFDINWKFE